MTIRPATVADREALIVLGYRLAQQVPAAINLRMGPIVDHRLADPASPILLAEDVTGPIGVLALSIGAHPDLGTRYAWEAAWWVVPSRAGRRALWPLVEAAEAWAKTQGLELVHLAAPFGSRLGVHLERHGYQAVEMSYTKQLP